MDIRKLEKTRKFGYLFFISYNGEKFDSFDENKGKISVKSVFQETLQEMGITWAKGVQQAARTDKGVSADENILYISTREDLDIDKVKDKFNKKNRYIKIKEIKKTIPDLIIPDMAEKKIYEYSYPKEKIMEKDEIINKRCIELTGVYDVSEYTDFKGLQLNEKIREVKVIYDENVLKFEGNSFMPKQVRIMSSYILTGDKKIFPAKYLTLKKVILKKEMNDFIIAVSEEIKGENIKKCEKMGEIFFIYTDKEKKSELIGKNARNIKELRRKYGEIIVKEI